MLSSSSLGCLEVIYTNLHKKIVIVINVVTRAFVSLNANGYIVLLQDHIVDTRFCTHDLIKKDDWNDHPCTP